MYFELIHRAEELAGEPADINTHAGFRLLTVLHDNERTLRQYCECLLSEAKAGQSLPPKAAWLIDNYSYIQSQIREIREAMPRAYYRDLPRMKTGLFRSDPRVYRLAKEIL